jgi:hypothetical protein
MVDQDSSPFVTWLESEAGFKAFFMPSARLAIRRAILANLPVRVWAAGNLPDPEDVASEMWLIIKRSGTLCSALERIFVEEGDARKAVNYLVQSYVNTLYDDAVKAGWHFLNRRLTQALREAAQKSRSGTLVYENAYFGFSPADEHVEAVWQMTGVASYASWPAPDRAVLRRTVDHRAIADILEVAEFFWRETVQQLNRRVLVLVHDLTDYIAAHCVLSDEVESQGGGDPDSDDAPSDEPVVPPVAEDRAILREEVRRVCDDLTDEECWIACARNEDTPWSEIAAYLGTQERQARNRVHKVEERLNAEIVAIARVLPTVSELQVALRILKSAKHHIDARNPT